MNESHPPEHMSLLISQLDQKLKRDRAAVLEVTTRQLNELASGLQLQMTNVLNTTSSAISQNQSLFQNQLESILSQSEQSVSRAQKTLYLAWLAPLLIGLSLFIGTWPIIWGLTQYQMKIYEDQQEYLDEIQTLIAAKENTLEILSQKTWGIELAEDRQGRWIVIPNDWILTPGDTFNGKQPLLIKRR